MNLVHNPGFELPIIPPDTPVAWTSHEIYTAAQGGGSSFVRRMALEFPRNHACKSLRRALEIADEVIEDAAEHIGAKAVQRIWGLYRDTGDLRENQRSRILKSDLIPENYFLVAEVPIISPAARLTETQTESIIPKFVSYYRHGRSVHILGDLGSRQCVYGVIAGGSETTSPHTWLVDAEPRVRSSYSSAID